MEKVQGTVLKKDKLVLNFSVHLRPHVLYVQVKLRGTYQDKADAGLDGW